VLFVVMFGAAALALLVVAFLLPPLADPADDPDADQ
jgi:hypothetical protein